MKEVKNMFREWRKTEKGFFVDFEKELEEMNEIIDNMMRTLGKEPQVYGFSMRIGPDGMQHVGQFGNAATCERKENTVREPYTSSIIDEKNNEFHITSEMPGINKEEIEVNATDNEVIIRAESGGRKYNKSIQTPSIDPESSKAKYNNGVLEVTFKLRESSIPKGKAIMIE